MTQNKGTFIDSLLGEEPVPCAVCGEPVPRHQGHKYVCDADTDYRLYVFHKDCVTAGVAFLNRLYPRAEEG